MSIQTSMFFNGHVGDVCRANECADGSVVHADGNGREAPNPPLHRVDDGGVHLGHACVGADA